MTIVKLEKDIAQIKHKNDPKQLFKYIKRCIAGIKVLEN